MKYEAAYNDLKEEILAANIREFDWDQYSQTPVYSAAASARDWGIEALAGVYILRYFNIFLLIKNSHF